MSSQYIALKFSSAPLKVWKEVCVCSGWLGAGGLGQDGTGSRCGSFLEGGNKTIAAGTLC